MFLNLIPYFICLIVLGIAIIALLLGKGLNSKRTRKYFNVVIFTILFIVVNLISEITDGKPSLSALTFAFNLIGFYLVDCIILSFLSYISSLLKKENSITKFLKSLIIFSTVIRVGLITVFAITGQLFSVKDGVYEEGGLNYITYVASAIIMVEFIALIICNKANFTKRQFVVVLIYEFIPIAPILVESFTDNYCLTAIGLMVSVLIIYMLIQDTALEENRMRQEILIEISKTDLLTGLQNRRSYFEAINKMQKKDAIGVIYCDINGLKKTNDHFGHIAGDELIRKFADILIEIFGVNSAYRLAGDEFVVLLQNTQQEYFEKQYALLKTKIKQNNNIAATGAGYGIVDCFDRLIKDAEDEMYKEKASLGVTR